MNERLSKGEIRKDAIQDGVEAAAAAVGQVTSIVVGAVGDVAKAVGGFATDLFEIKDAAKRAQEDAGTDAPTSAHLDPDVRTGGVAEPDVHPDPDAPTA